MFAFPISLIRCIQSRKPFQKLTRTHSPASPCARCFRRPTNAQSTARTEAQSIGVARSVTKSQIFDINCQVVFFDLRFRQNLRIQVARFNDLFNTRPNMAKRRLQKFVDREVQSSLTRRLCTHWFMFVFANVLVLLFWTRLLDTPTETWAETFKRRIKFNGNLFEPSESLEVWVWSVRQRYSVG